MNESSSSAPPDLGFPLGRSPGRRSVVTALAATALLGLAGAGSCAERKNPAETVDSLRAKSRTLQNRTRLRIGARDDVPFMFYEANGERSGFEIEIAKEMASNLGFGPDRIDWVPVRTLPERLSVLGDRADMVVANISITKARAELVEFAGPYQLIPQAVLVHADRAKPLETLPDLQAPGVRVCTTTGSTSEESLKAKGITPDLYDTNAACMAKMKARRYDAFSTDLPILAGLREADRLQTGRQTFDILEIAIADVYEQIGIAVPKGDTAMRDLVAYFLDQWYRLGQDTGNSPWLRAFDRTIGPLLDTKYRSQPRIPNPPQLKDYGSKAPLT
jgi:glutamate transport system substrate-binding protein